MQNCEQCAGKKCTKCGKEKPLTEFYADKSRKSGLMHVCKYCHNRKPKNRVRNWREQNLRRSYRLSLKEYDAMFINQGGVCLICKGDNRGELLHVDHDHQTGTVRGLLCRSCNLALGYIHDNHVLARKMATYLQGFSNASA